VNIPRELNTIENLNSHFKKFGEIVNIQVRTDIRSLGTRVLSGSAGAVEIESRVGAVRAASGRSRRAPLSRGCALESLYQGIPLADTHTLSFSLFLCLCMIESLSGALVGAG
jgi:hypothetical protein